MGKSQSCWENITLVRIYMIILLLRTYALIKLGCFEFAITYSKLVITGYFENLSITVFQQGLGDLAWH